MLLIGGCCSVIYAYIFSFILVNGNRYEGEWLSDLKHGTGVFYYHDKSQKYIGEWIDGKHTIRFILLAMFLIVLLQEPPQKVH